jgi:hypothetical protein
VEIPAKSPAIVGEIGSIQERSGQLAENIHNNPNLGLKTALLLVDSLVSMPHNFTSSI